MPRGCHGAGCGGTLASPSAIAALVAGAPGPSFYDPWFGCPLLWPATSDLEASVDAAFYSSGTYHPRPSTPAATTPTSARCNSPQTRSSTSGPSMWRSTYTSFVTGSPSTLFGFFTSRPPPSLHISSPRSALLDLLWVLVQPQHQSWLVVAAGGVGVFSLCFFPDQS
jgi:hypothetical protein